MTTEGPSFALPLIVSGAKKNKTKAAAPAAPNPRKG